jgi:hypothetical protein
VVNEREQVSEKGRINRTVGGGELMSQPMLNFWYRSMLCECYRLLDHDRRDWYHCYDHAEEVENFSFPNSAGKLRLRCTAYRFAFTERRTGGPPVQQLV